MVAEVAIRLGLLSLGNYARLEFCHIAVDPGGIGRSQSIYSRPVRGSTGIAPAHNACQIPEAFYGTREWAPRVTLREKKRVLSGHTSGQQSSMPAPLGPPSLRVYLTPLFPGPLPLPGKHPCLPSRSRHTACPAG